jgi:uncharacterized protein (DUF2235 family)
MAITKCRIWLRPVTGITVATQALRQGGRTAIGWSTLLQWRKHMSNTEMTVTQPETASRKPALSLNKETLRQLKVRTWLDDVVGGGAVSTVSTARGELLYQHAYRSTTSVT